MAISRCPLLSGRRSLSSCTNLLSSFSLVDPFSPPSPPNPLTILPSSLFSRSAISIHPPHKTLISFQFYTSSSDPPQSNFSVSDSDSETLINRDCEKEPPSLIEMVKRSSQKVMTPMELQLPRKKKEQERECHIKLPPPFDPIKREPPSLQELFNRKPSSQRFMNPKKQVHLMMKSTLTEVEFRNVLIEAKKNPKCAVRELRRMLGDGVAPNADTYAVLIKKLAGDGDEKGMKPSVVAYTDMFEALVKGGKEAEAREMVEIMKGKGFEFDEKRVRELLKWKIKIGDVSARDVISILFGK